MPAILFSSPTPGGAARSSTHWRARDVPARVMVRRDDARAAELRVLGVEVVVGDLTRPETVAAALEGVGRMYFWCMPGVAGPVAAATVVASVAREQGELDGLVDMSQMTVSQMTATSTGNSHQQRLHWLSEQVLDWSGLPVVHIGRRRSWTIRCSPHWRRDRSGQRHDRAAVRHRRTSPVAVDDVARVVATVLRDPAPHVGHVYELTGPRTVDMTEMAEEFSRALGRPVSYVDVPLGQWRTEVLAEAGLPLHTEQHIATMARLHRENRYDRALDDVERVTGVPARTIEAFVAARRDFYLG